MKVIACAEIAPGMVLGKAVESEGNQLYPAGTTIDSVVIEQLAKYDIAQVMVKDEADLRFNERFQDFEQKYTDCLNRCKGAMLSFLGTKQRIQDNVLLQIYDDAYEKISTGSELLNFLYHMMPGEDELTYVQCLNSALLAGTFADWLSMSEEDKKILILCGFYYDIGKWTLPYDILWKPGKLTDEEFKMVKTHPVIGYNLVRYLDLNEHVKNAIIMHHEKFDGSGYPYHMKGSNIDIFARYIAIIDTYIAMASARTYRDAFTPLQILGNFEKNMAQYDIELLMPLMKRIADAQTGNAVQLSDGSIWEVLIINQNKTSRPVLRNDKDQILDLAKRSDLEIVKNVQ
ncbi:MAG: HD domain-containing protein [Candidatus Gastranaerophilales bacterium]|nr:HD domain-containing protein [Candidatus Gastranaerophilales bacterium]